MEHFKVERCNETIQSVHVGRMKTWTYVKWLCRCGHGLPMNTAIKHSSQVCPTRLCSRKVRRIKWITSLWLTCKRAWQAHLYVIMCGQIFWMNTVRSMSSRLRGPQSFWQVDENCYIQPNLGQMQLEIRMCNVESMKRHFHIRTKEPELVNTVFVRAHINIVGGVIQSSKGMLQRGDRLCVW